MYASRFAGYDGRMGSVLNRVGFHQQVRIGIASAPPHAYFLVSAVFHYLGPAFAVLLFARLDALGVAWLRIAAAAAVFAAWRRPWRVWSGPVPARRRLLVAWGVVLGAMNV